MEKPHSLVGGGEQEVDDGFVLVPEATKPGTLFIEARLRDYLPEEFAVGKLEKLLQTQLSTVRATFELFEEILSNDKEANLKLGSHCQKMKDVLLSLKVVEYLGPKTIETCFSSKNVNIKVQVYMLDQTPRSLEHDKKFPQAELTSLPHLRFEGIWDQLVFAEEVKEDLIWMMTNLLRFSQSAPANGGMSPLILLYGPPGTGKTSLCQGLAQKISIRLGSTYDQTTLVQIKSASLLSKFYSESAKQVEDIFIKIGHICEENEDGFVCVLIDEVESIASSRQLSMRNGESQDTLRATNALLTGIDRMSDYSNVMFLCTSNMLEVLDSAFLDRCSLNREIKPPSIASQYEILRGRLQHLISRKVIQSDAQIPSFDHAEFYSVNDPNNPGSRLLSVVKHINSGDSHRESRTEASGRRLTQLPEQAIMQYLRGDVCTLDLALSFIGRLVIAEQGQTPVECKESEETVNDSDGDDDVAEITIRTRGKKRRRDTAAHEDVILEVFEKVITGLRKRFKFE